MSRMNGKKKKTHTHRRCCSFPGRGEILGKRSSEAFRFFETFLFHQNTVYNGLGGANPAVNTPRPSRGTRIESCDFIVLVGDP